MALEKFEFPATGTVTNSFLPSRNPSFADAEEEIQEPVIAEQSSGKGEYLYDEGVKLRFYRRVYARMANSERVSYESFRDVVGGQKLKFTDYNAVAHTVTFSEFRRQFTQSTGTRWTFEIAMREEL